MATPTRLISTIGGLRSLRGLAAVLPLLFALYACAPQEPIRIGFLGALSGRVTDLGISGLYGARLAVEQRNAADGIRGRAIELHIEDDRHDPESARKAFRRLAAKDVVAIVGPMTSVIAQTVLPLANEAQIPLLSPTATSTQLSGNDDYFLRVIPSTAEFSTTTARHFLDRTALRRIRPVIDISNAAYSKSWLRDFSETFEAGGGSLLDPVTFITDDGTDFDTLARRTLAGEPEAVLIVAGALDTAMLCEAVRRRHQTIPLAAAEWAGTERLIELGGSAVEGLLVAQVDQRQSATPNFQDFREAFLKRYGREPDFAAIKAYDAAAIVLTTLDAGTPPHDLKNGILKRSSFEGRQGSIVIDGNGDARAATATTMVIRRGQWESSEP